MAGGFPVRCLEGIERWRSLAKKIGEWQKTSCSELGCWSNLMTMLVVEKFRNEMYQVWELKVELGHATSIYAVSMVNGVFENRHEGADGEERPLLQMTETVVGEKGRSCLFLLGLLVCSRELVPY